MLSVCFQSPLLTHSLLVALPSESINFQLGQLVQTFTLELTAQSLTSKQQKGPPKAKKQEIWHRRT